MTAPTPRLVPDRPSDMVKTGPYVDRIVRIFRDRPYDDTTALVLIEFAQAAIAARDAAAPPAEAPGEVLRRALVRIAMGEDNAQKIADDAIAASRLAAYPAAPAPDTAGDKPVMWQYRRKGSDDKWITGEESLNADYDKDYWEVRSLYTQAPRVTGGREDEWRTAESLLRKLGQPGMADSAAGFRIIEAEVAKRRLQAATGGEG